MVVSGKIQTGQRAVEDAAGRGRRNSCLFMPPEQVPWDRRDFRKHDRFVSDPRFGGVGFGGAGPHRWREQHHYNHAPPPPPVHPPPYHHHHNQQLPQQQQQRWYADFRSSRPISSGHGKHGGWHMYPDDAGHGFLPFGSRYGDRCLEDDNFQHFGSCIDKRYFRINKENKGSCTQKDWRSSSWEPAVASSGPFKLTTVVNNQKIVDNTETCHNNSKSNESCCPLLDSISDQSQSIVKEKQEKVDIAADCLANSCQKPEKEKGLESVDWKPLKWTRSGSLPSRGSSIGHMSGTKSIRVDSVETVAEVQQSVIPVQLADTSNDGSTDPTSSEENNSRKKPRLGWGEGLAKFEKKKVEIPEDGAAKDGLVVNVTATEIMQSPVNQYDKSPRIASMADCMPPATSSSITCSSSGIEEKDSMRLSNVTQDNVNLACSPCITSQMYYEGPTLNFENLDITSIAKVSSVINGMLQSEDLGSVETKSVQATSMTKLLVLKAGILKALEVTESSLDSLETELKLLTAEPRVCSSCPAVYSLLPGDCPVKACEQPAAGYAFSTEPAPLKGVSSANIVVENMPGAINDWCETLQGGEIISPDNGAFNKNEVLSSMEDICPGTAEFEDMNNSKNLNQKGVENGSIMDIDVFHVDEDDTADRCQNTNTGNRHSDVNHIYDSILTANKESASCSMKELNKFLPSRRCSFDISMSSNNMSFQRDSLAIKEKFLLRRRSLKFKEKVLTLKFKVFQHFWKEGRVVSVRELQGKSHKISDISYCGHKKSRSCNRSRISYFASNHRSAAAEEVMKCINELLIESSCKPCRSTLKMPILILDKESTPQFISNNGLVEDPSAVEEERYVLNPWMAEEREIFIDKLSVYGKNFSKIASFLDHRTAADCIEFYYKNHKSECFARARKKPEFSKRRKTPTTTYLVATGKRRNREINAASLDILGEASAVASNANDVLATQQRCTPRLHFGVSNSHRASNGIYGSLQRSYDLDFYSNETAAADVLAGICGSRSSEAMSSCITSAFDHADRCQDWKGPIVKYGSNWTSTPDYGDNVDEECSDESCGEMVSVDWTDEETSIFVQAVSSYGKDFVMISQLVRTKSKEQCEIFFSKARKCLGLDQMHGVACNSVPGDTYGDGSDNEDGCVVQTGSLVSLNGSGYEIKEDLPCHEMKPVKVSHESVDVAIHDIKPHVLIFEENNRSSPLDSVAVESVLENSSTADAQMGDTPFTDCSAVSKGQNDICGSELQARTFTSSHMEPGQAEEEHSCVQADGTNEAVKDSSPDSSPDSSGSCPEESEAAGFILPEDNLHTKEGADRDAKSIEFTAVSHAPSRIKSNPQQSENVSSTSVYTQISMQAESECQKDAVFESFSAEKCRKISSHGSGHVLEISVPTKDQTILGQDALENVSVMKIDEKLSFESVRTSDDRGLLSGYSHLDIADSTQILRGYPVSGQSVKEINDNVNNKRHTLQSIPELSGNLHSDRYSDFSIQKCTTHHNEVSQAPHTSQGKSSKDNSRPLLGWSADSEMRSRTGDVKLFGKILISSQQNPNSCVQEICGDNHRVASCQSPKLSGNQKGTFDPPLSKFDYNKCMGSENIPVRGYGFGNGNKTVVAFPPLSDPSLLLAKYPASATLGSHSDPSMKLAQPPLHGVVRSNPSPLNGVSVFPSRELSSMIGVADRQMLRNHCEILQRQDVLFSEMRRRNVFDAVNGMQMQQGAMEMLGINVVGSRVGVVVGGGSQQQHPAAELSDPVSAMKMHFAKAQNRNAGSW